MLDSDVGESAQERHRCAVGEKSGYQNGRFSSLGLRVNRETWLNWVACIKVGA